jgi:hypothetical protein
MVGRGGGDRKLNLLSQVLSCQRRSTAALLPIGVKWCQVLGPTSTRGQVALSGNPSDMDVESLSRFNPFQNPEVSGAIIRG